MGRYRKIDTRIWNDERFREFSDNGKLAFMFLLTHPSMTCLGAMRATFDGLAAELGWTPDAIRHAMSYAILAGMIEVDEKAAFIALRNWLKYNKPEGPNSIKGGWVEALDLIPECPGKKQVIARCCAYLASMSEAMQKAVLEWVKEWEMASGMPCPMPCRIPEPEPDPDPEQDPEVGDLPEPGGSGEQASRKRRAQPAKSGKLPFRAQEALHIIAVASRGRFKDTNPGGQAVDIEKFIKAHPDRNAYALIGAYIAGGGEKFAGEIMDSRWATQRNLDAALARAQDWDAKGRPNGAGKSAGSGPESFEAQKRRLTKEDEEQRWDLLTREEQEAAMKGEL